MLVALAGSARADGSAADEAFKKGRELLKAGKYVEACEQFEISERLDPQLGTRFNIAQCDEHIGKLATALAIYRDLAASDTNATRKATSADLAEKVAPRVPKLLVQLSKPPAGVEVRLDGRTIALDTVVDLDFGEHTVAVKAAGFADFKNTIHTADEGRTTTLVVTLLPEQPAAPPLKPVVTATTEASPRSHRKLYAIGALATGGGAVVTGLIFGSLARSAWHDAQAVCAGMTCDTQADLDRANSLRDTANKRAAISTVLVIAGGAAAITGVALWVTAPSEHGVAVAAHPTGDGATVTLSGRF